MLIRKAMCTVTVLKKVFFRVFIKALQHVEPEPHLNVASWSSRGPREEPEGRPGGAGKITRVS